ncbi:hypothetical protein ACI703_15755 [Isoptericola jiangsuensis]|uniref:hypothetical protein n=1 Tax=Isoptericola jiangsuensis TaxID=548579 RepID=UPI00386EBECF
MKHGRTDRDWAIVAVMTFCAGALVTWALLSHDTYHSATAAKIDWPAWVQALGSIAAIGVAIYVPWRQRANAMQDEARKERIRRRIIAAAIYPALAQYQTATAQLLKLVDADHERRKGIPAEGIRRPVEFDQFREDLYLLGDLGNMVNEVIGTHERIWTSSKALHLYPIVHPKTRARLVSEFPGLIEDMGICIEALRGIADGR